MLKEITGGTLCLAQVPLPMAWRQMITSNRIALALRERWPGMHKEFRHYCHTYHQNRGALGRGRDRTRRS